MSETLTRQEQALARWSRWSTDVHAFLEQGNVEQAAQILASCLPRPQDEGDRDFDLAPRRDLFSQDFLQQFHQVLYERMRSDNRAGDVDDYGAWLYKTLTEEFGWQIHQKT